MQTEQLKDIFSVLTNIIKEDKVRPITDLVEIRAESGIAQIACTDNRTALVVDIEEEDDIPRTVVSLSLLAKLVKMTTKEEVKFKKHERYLEMKGDGKYKLPIQLDETGKGIQLNIENTLPDVSDIKPTTHNPRDLEALFLHNSIALHVCDDDDYNKMFSAYYNTGKGVVTTDSIMISYLKKPSIPEGEVQYFVIEQLSKLPTGELQLYELPNGFYGTMNRFRIFIYHKKFGEFPIDLVEPFLAEPKEQFENHFSISCATLLLMLKRASLFKNPFGVTAITLATKYGQFLLRNPQESVEEQIESEDVVIKDDVSATVDVDRILMALKRTTSLNVVIHVSNNAICVEDTKGFYIIGVLED